MSSAIRVLVTGATGFIGRHTVDALLAAGHDVHAVTSRGGGSSADATWYRADLLEPGAAAALVATVHPTHLLHLAWYAEPGKFWTSLENYRWLEASIALVRAFAERGGQRIVLAGTCAEYDWRHGFCSEHITPRRSATPYAACKNALFDTLSSLAERASFSAAWGRVFLLYGPHEAEARLVPSVITALLRDERARCTHGNQIRDFLHVADVASAFAALVTSDVRGAVNIASGIPVTIRDVVLAAAYQLGAPDRVEFGALAAPANEPPLVVGDARRIRNEVGWAPKYDLSSGIEETIGWWSRTLVAR
jgi:nucleoside-diphosphate-sugar epimerase